MHRGGNNSVDHNSSGATRSDGSLPGAGQQVQPADDQFLSAMELAARWGCSTKTLANHRWRGEGCPSIRIGRLVRYRLREVLAFEQAGSTRR